MEPWPKKRSRKNASSSVGAFSVTESSRQAPARQRLTPTMNLRGRTLSSTLPICGSENADASVPNRYSVVIFVSDIPSVSMIASVVGPMHGDWPGELMIFPAVHAIRMTHP